MPLVKIPAIKAPTVSIYIRITDEKGRRRYQRARPRSPQPCSPRDSFALLYYAGGRQKWEQVGQDYSEAVRRRAAKEHELLQAAREQHTQPDTPTKAPSSLEELRSVFLAMKRKERKRDRTPLDEYTIRAYEGLVQDFIFITKCQYPGDVTGDRINDWMLVLEDGYVGPDGKEHKPAAPRTAYNLYTNLGCFLRYSGIEPNPSNRHSYGLRKLHGVNVPGKNETDPEAYTEEEWTRFMFCVTDERDVLAFELFLKSGPREQELANLEWTDLNLGDTPWVAYQCKEGFRTKTGKSRRVPLERGLADSYDTCGFVYGVNDRVCQITIRKVIDKTSTDFFKMGLANPRASDCGKVGGNCKNCGIGFETK